MFEETKNQHHVPIRSAKTVLIILAWTFVLKKNLQRLEWQSVPADIDSFLQLST